MPGDLARVVARKVAQLQRLPQRQLGTGQRAVQGQDLPRLLLAGLQIGVQVGPGAAQRTQAVAKQVFEQLAFPGVPDLRAGAADVGHGPQVQRRQPPYIAHLVGKSPDHVGVRQILFLRHRAHRQVVLDQKLGQRAVFLGNPMVATEAPHLERAQLGVVAASAFGNVVEQRCDVEQPRLVPFAGQLRAKRVLVGMLRDEEAPHVAQHHQDVLVHRVDVEQVVLHAADDAAKDPEVATQHRGLVQQSQRARDALRLAQQVHELRAVDRVAPEGRAHHLARVVERTQRAGRQTLNTGVLLKDQESLKNGLRLVDVELVARHLEHAGAVEEVLVDATHRRGLAGVDALLDVEHQDLVELAHRLGRPVIVVHQHLGRSGASAVVVAEALGHGGLQIEHQPVLAPARHRVQPGPDQLERALVALQLLDLESRDQAVGGKLGPVAAESRSASDPGHGLQVAQAAGAFLAVGFQRIGRVLVLGVTLLHL